MSTFEKIALGVIGILLIVLGAFSYRELTEPREQGSGPSFEESVGQRLIIGPYATLVSQRSSGGQEENCEALKPVLIGVLHDIKERLEHQAGRGEQPFEVNEATLTLLCSKQATITLMDSGGTKLLLNKGPFVRKVPQGGLADDVGTDVRIDATVVPPGAVPPTQPTTYGEALIPDKYLDQSATSSTDNY